MKKSILIAVHEYKRHVLRRRFLFTLLSVPMFIAFIGFVVFLLISLENNSTPLGYIDHSGLLSSIQPARNRSGISGGAQWIHYESEEFAAQALDDGEIQGYYVLEQSFLEDSKARLVAMDEIGSDLRAQFRGFIREQLLAGELTDVRTRILNGSNIIIRSPDGSRQFGENEWYNTLSPMLVGFIFMITIFSTAGYLVQTVTEEKENRTVEVLVTSASPGQLMAGKISGIIAVGITLLLIWFGVIILAVLTSQVRPQLVEGLLIEPEILLQLVMIFIPSFIMIAGLMAAIGSIVSEAREGQQLSALVTLPLVIPFWFVAQIMNEPNSILSLSLSLFPLTAPVAITLRAAFTTIPAWQIGLNILILTFAAGLALWLAGRTFRLGMLQYGKRLSIQDILK